MIQIKKSKKKIILIQKTLGKYDEGPSSCAVKVQYCTHTFKGMLKEDVSLPPFTFYMVKSTYLAYLLVSVLYRIRTHSTCR